jgi:hypothetical protein
MARRAPQWKLSLDHLGSYARVGRTRQQAEFRARAAAQAFAQLRGWTLLYHRVDGCMEPDANIPPSIAFTVEIRDESDAVLATRPCSVLYYVMGRYYTSPHGVLELATVSGVRAEHLPIEEDFDLQDTATLRLAWPSQTRAAVVATPVDLIETAIVALTNHGIDPQSIWALAAIYSDFAYATEVDQIHYQWERILRDADEQTLRVVLDEVLSMFGGAYFTPTRKPPAPRLTLPELGLPDPAPAPPAPEPNEFVWAGERRGQNVWWNRARIVPSGAGFEVEFMGEWISRNDPRGDDGERIIRAMPFAEYISFDVDDLLVPYRELDTEIEGWIWGEGSLGSPNNEREFLRLNNWIADYLRAHE